MKFIYDQLGDWYLSMAGYDWGGRQRAARRAKDRLADFWNSTSATICPPKHRIRS